MDLTMMGAAERHRELIAHLATERARLRQAQMVRIRRLSTANQAGLFHDVPDMVTVTNASRFWESKDTLIDLWCPGLLGQTLLECSRSLTSFCVFGREDS